MPALRWAMAVLGLCGIQNVSEGGLLYNPPWSAEEMRRDDVNMVQGSEAAAVKLCRAVPDLSSLYASREHRICRNDALSRLVT